MNGGNYHSVVSECERVIAIWKSKNNPKFHMQKSEWEQLKCLVKYLTFD